ncbi:unnamed protein product [[Candida] boidinii]|nr:unnamed protein product [[Candida] boidinii]
MEEFLGMILLAALKSPLAESRILDTNSSVDYRDLDVSLADILVNSTNPAPPSTALVTSTKKSSKRKNLICKRCQEAGHISTQCTAPAPVAPKVSAGNSNNFNSSPASSAHSSGNSGRSNQSWMATSLISLEGTDSNHYWMDSGSTVLNADQVSG